MQTNVFLGDMNLPSIRPQDTRKLEVVVHGLPLYHGAQVGIDATIVSPVRGDGMPRPGADRKDGIAIRDAVRKKQRRYRELTGTQRCRLVVAAVEVGGRWQKESYQFLVHMAKAKAQQAPAILRTALTAAWVRRWTGMLAHAAMTALADSLTKEHYGTSACSAGTEPLRGELLCEAC